MTRQLKLLVGADVMPDENSGVAGTVMETSRALEAFGHHVESFWADSLTRRIAHGNLHYIVELPRALRRAVKDRMARASFDVIQLSQPHSYLAGRMVLGCPSRPLMVWRSHGLEAKVDDAIERHAPPRAASWRAALRRISGNRLRRAQREAVRWTDGVIVPCEDDKRYLVEHFGASDERVRVIWHGVPDEYIDAPQSGDSRRWHRILHVSQFSANKGPMVMHEVAARLLEARPDASMTWVCPQSRHGSIREQLPERLRSRIELLDWVDRTALMDLYDAHGLFLFPTLAEGAAKVVMEAMARGLCVVSSDTSGPRDYISQGENGLLVPVGSSSAMANAAIELLESDDRGPRMGAAATATAAKFRWSRCARQMLYFYEDLAALRFKGDR